MDLDRTSPGILDAVASFGSAGSLFSPAVLAIAGLGVLALLVFLIFKPTGQGFGYQPFF